MLVGGLLLGALGCCLVPAAAQALLLHCLINSMANQTMCHAAPALLPLGCRWLSEPQLMLIAPCPCLSPPPAEREDLRAAVQEDEYRLARLAAAEAQEFEEGGSSFPGGGQGHVLV